MMKFVFCTLLVCAPGGLALRTPKKEDGFHRVSELPSTVSSTEAVDAAIKYAPAMVEVAVAFGRSMNGSHQIADALQETTAAPKNITSFVELEGKIESAMERSHAWTEMKNIMGFARKRLLNTKIRNLGINSINIGLARSGAPWYSLMKSLSAEASSFQYFDENDVKLVGAVAFFLNMAFDNSKSGQLVQGKWKICMAASLSASVYFRGKFYQDEPGFEGSDFGGEDFYFAFANSDNVPGWSWSMGFNHDYVRRYLGGSKLPEALAAYKYADVNHQFSHLSRLSGGFEFTSTGPLKDLVAINFGYCIMGRSQGGECVDKLEGDERVTDTEKEIRAKIEADRKYQIGLIFPGFLRKVEDMSSIKGLSKDEKEWKSVIDTIVEADPEDDAAWNQLVDSANVVGGKPGEIKKELQDILSEELKDKQETRVIEVAESMRNKMLGLKITLTVDQGAKLIRKLVDKDIEPPTLNVLAASDDEGEKIADALSVLSTLENHVKTIPQTPTTEDFEHVAKCAAAFFGFYAPDAHVLRDPATAQEWVTNRLDRGMALPRLDEIEEPDLKLDLKRLILDLKRMMYPQAKEKREKQIVLTDSVNDARSALLKKEALALVGAFFKKQFIKTYLADWKEEESSDKDLYSKLIAAADPKETLGETPKFGLTSGDLDKAEEAEDQIETIMAEAVDKAKQPLPREFNLITLEGEKQNYGEVTESKMKDILSAEKWSKNTVETGVGHCWCSPKWKSTWDLSPFS